ncbi:MAG TPA: cytochrome c biogenesis protein CcdA [Oceanobacillus sp.]|nr:cytochrome c biogenesis protein CcdA [Oceanobacillus sp.]
MSDLLTAFSLGNAAILTNACMLPLYPGLIAFLAGNADDSRSRRATGWLGLLVLAGILTMMLIIGLVLYLLQQSFGVLLPYVLPLIYGIVIVLGVMTLLDRSPFARLATAQTPMLRNPYGMAYVYGLLFGPMTLPCTGPVITSAFLLGANDARALADGLIWFLAFGVGFGWPLVMLPLLALPLQRRLVGGLARYHQLLNRAAGILLIAVGVFGILTELLPQYTSIVIEQAVWFIYWGIVAALIIVVSIVSYRAARERVTESGR